jgi:hypothetical protein
MTIALPHVDGLLPDRLGMPADRGISWLRLLSSLVGTR